MDCLPFLLTNWFFPVKEERKAMRKRRGKKKEEFVVGRKETIFVGTYTQPILFGTGQILEGKGKGIYRYELDLDTGTLVQADALPDVDNPSYLVLSDDHKTLYAVNELKEFGGRKGGAVSAFSVDPDSKKLTFLNQQPTFGTDPCHVVLSKSGSHVFVSNFMSGSVCVYPVQPDGSLGEASHFVQHEGSSVNEKRQKGPHAHSTTFSPDGRFAFVPDLGTDTLVAYQPDEATGTLRNAVSFFTEPGAGPRHCVFHPNGRFCYLTNELDCTIYALKYNQEEGTFEKLQTVPLMQDPAFHGENSGADIQITPDGRFLYGSNRGHNSLIGYEVDGQTGLLRYAGMTDCRGGVPRNFAIDPTGTYVIVANQDTDNLVVFSICQDGSLKYLSQTFAPTPVCVRPYLMEGRE